MKKTKIADLKQSSNNKYPLRSAVWFATGAILGAIVGYGYQFFQEESLYLTPAETYIEEPPKKDLLNPLIASTFYKNHSWIQLKNIDLVIKSDIEQAIREGRVVSASAYIRDLTNDERFTYNEEEVFSPGSLMKVPVLISILKHAESNPSALSTQLIFNGPQEAIHLDQRNRSEVYVSKLIKGSTYTINELLDFMIVASDNEATILLIDYLMTVDPTFMKRVEEDLGLFIPLSTNSNDNFITVKRYASFFRTLFNASYLSDESSQKALQLLSRSGYGYGIRQSIPKDVAVAHKYGVKLGADGVYQLHHFGIVYHRQKPFLIGIMTKGKNMGELKALIANITFDVFAQVNMQTNDGGNSYLARDVTD